MEKIEELDGVRGLAIIMVLFYHLRNSAKYLTANPYLLKFADLGVFGWTGVDLFFVLSGFLITTILLHSKNHPSYFKNFYARRILRIFPMYYTAIGIVFLFLPVIDNQNGVTSQAFWPIFLVYLQNWLLVFQRASSAIGVTWSLAIEEQFYLAWPAGVRFFNRSTLILFGLTAIATSILIRIILISTLEFGVARNAIYHATVTRLDGLMVGALIAIVFDTEEWKPVLKKFALPVLMISIVGLIFLTKGGRADIFTATPLMNGVGYTLLALMGGGIIVLNLTLPKENLIRIVFRSAILRFFGKYSYAIYLFHVPLVLLVTNYFVENDRMRGTIYLEYLALVVGGSVLLSLISWNLIEKPFLSWKHLFK